MLDKEVVKKIIESCGNCDNFIPTNPYAEENPIQGSCELDPDDIFCEYESKDQCDKNPVQWKQRRVRNPAFAYGCINQCPECGRWSYFIHDMNIDDCITENEGFCSYCGFTQVEEY